MMLRDLHPRSEGHFDTLDEGSEVDFNRSSAALRDDISMISSAWTMLSEFAPVTGGAKMSILGIIPRHRHTYPTIRSRSVGTRRRCLKS